MHTHIRNTKCLLHTHSNTQERKPVTNSRDTQELLPEAGQEMLKIFFTHPARTSLLQDFAFYELQAAQKMAQAQAAAQGNSNNGSPTASNAGGPPGQGGNSPMLPNQQFNPAGNLNAGMGPAGNGGPGNPNALAYQMPMMSPMLQMGLQMNLDHGVGRQGGGYPGPAGQVRQGPGGNGAGQVGVSQGLQNSVMRNPSPAPAGATGTGGNGGKW
jgi:YTH domain-containing family protein